MECIYNIGVDHLAFLSSEKIDAMNEQEYQKILEYQLKASAERNIAGTSLHGLVDWEKSKIFELLKRAITQKIIKQKESCIF